MRVELPVLTQEFIQSIPIAHIFVFHVSCPYNAKIVATIALVY